MVRSHFSRFKSWLITDVVFRRLLREFRFLVLFLAGAVATFPLFVPPFFLPLYSNSLGLSSGVGAGLVAGFNFSSAVGRLSCGYMCDRMGPLNTLFLSLCLSAGSMLVIWPVSTTLAPLIVFVFINGVGNGGFFSTMPTVVGSVFGSARVSVAMGMIVTGWAGGYLMVNHIDLLQSIERHELINSRVCQLPATFLMRTEESTVHSWRIILLSFTLDQCLSVHLGW